MNSLKDQLSRLKLQIEQAAISHQRLASSVELLAVSKTQPASKIKALYELGQRAFGENYVKEALEKQAELSELNIQWHFIGPIQSNKTRDIAEHFQWVHSVDRIKIAKRLSEQRPSHLPPLQICLQINIDNEETKSGIHMEELPELVEACDSLANIKLRGLMAIPKAGNSEQEQIESFCRLTEAMKTYSKMDTLSMGMSADMNNAIACGSTIVRVGTALFGKREPKT